MQSSNVPQGVVDELDRGAALYEEFSSRMNALRDDGLVDCKMKLFAGRSTTTAGVVATVNNVLRLLAAGEARPLILD